MNRTSKAGLALLVGWCLVSTVAGATEKPAAVARCPLRLNQRSVGLPRTCLFVGRYNGECGAPALAIFAGNGETVVVGFAFSQTGPTTYFAGDVVSDTEASLAIWQRSLQVLAASEVSGRLTLTDGGRELHVQLATAPFQVEGCRFGEYVGRFVDMVDAGDDAPGRLPSGWESASARRLAQ